MKVELPALLYRLQNLADCALEEQVESKHKSFPGER